MYAREIDGREHTFGVSGKLIMNALVMYDHQTRTLWSQFLGSGVQGDLAGTELEFVPVTHTTWAAWKEAHPDTKVLDKGGRYRRDSYTSYYGSGSAGVLGEATKDDRLDRKDLVVRIDLDGNAKAYPFEELLRQPVINDMVGGRDIFIYMDRATETALAYSRVVDGRMLTFRLQNAGSGPQARLADDETGSSWIALTGVAIEGPLKGQVLERAPSHLSFWFAWKDWNPDTELYELGSG